MSQSNDVPAIVNTVEELRRAVQAARQKGQSIGFVPTMGALHEGHRSLIRAATKQCDTIVVSIFLNPTQFGENEDLDKYPRTLNEDLAACQEEGARIVFCPPVAEVYSDNATTIVDVQGLSQILEGESRPTHFRGVTTIVLKLFNMVQPDTAFFGQKDYQQHAVIQRMVDDLDIPVEIVLCPTVREQDGLAMSSRNRFLSDEDREAALKLPLALNEARTRLTADAESDIDSIVQRITKRLDIDKQVALDYFTIVDPQTLQPIKTAQPVQVALIAATVGETRLIDNMIIRKED